MPELKTLTIDTDNERAHRRFIKIPRDKFNYTVIEYSIHNEDTYNFGDIHIDKHLRIFNTYQTEDGNLEDLNFYITKTKHYIYINHGLKSNSGVYKMKYSLRGPFYEI